MTTLPVELQNALQHQQLLVIWAAVPLSLSEREPANRALAINQLIEQAKNLPAITTPLSDLPPVTILGLDPTGRIEQAFKSAGVALRVVKTRGDVRATGGHNLLKLGGDLASRAGVVLSREGVRDLLSDADKRYLIDEARRIAQEGVVLIVGADPANVDFQAWWRVIQPALGAANVFAIGDGPADVPQWAIDFDILINELKELTMPEEPGDSSRSGGVNINSGKTDVGGDVTGRDKIVSAGGHIIHAGAGATVNIGSEHSNAPRRSQAARRDDDEREAESLRRQLAEAHENLLLIEERISEYVMGAAVDLQLIKQQRRLKERIVELEQQLTART